VHRDFFALHESLLGRSLGNILGDFEPKTVNINEAMGSFFERLSAHNGTVLTTQLGSYGDSGTGGFAHFLSLQQNARTRFLDSEVVYRQAITAQQIMRSAVRTMITEGPLCMGMNLGLDNRGLLPPFSPVQRNEDGVFGALLRARHAYFGYLPWMIHHQAPTDRRKTMEELWSRAAIVGAGDILVSLINTAVSRAIARPELALNQAAATFIDFAELPIGRLHEAQLEVLWRSASNRLDKMAKLLAHYKEPEFWRKDSEQYMDALRAAMCQKEYHLPIDLREAFGAEHALEMLQKIMGRFGESLIAWPEISQTMLHLRRDGCRPGIKV
jgi:hypothetical protein